jgi:nitrate reductase gamma subunit
MLGAVLPFAAPPFSGSSSPPFPLRLAFVLGPAGTILTVAGAGALLVHRLREPQLRAYTTAGDVFNLLFFMTALSVLGLGCLELGPSYAATAAIVRGLLTFDLALEIPGLLAAGLVMSALLAAYVPLTHMSHFIAKFFTYHSVRWDDAPSLKGGRLEVKIAEYLTYRPTWAAAHVAADGRKTWAEVAGQNPAREVRE